MFLYLQSRADDKFRTEMSKNAEQLGACGIANPYSFSKKQAAAFLGVSEPTLDRWRKDGSAPAHAILGGRVKFAMSDLIAWLESRKVERRSVT